MRILSSVLRNRAILGIAAVFLLPGYNSCDPIIENNGFDLWCGDQLCSWQVDKGDIRRVPTWHTTDYGVELVGDQVSISQFSDITGNNSICIRFDLVADIEETAEVQLILDLFDDGVADYQRPIPTSSWAPVSYLIHLPAHYQGIRFRITKEGAGVASLAQVRAEEAEGCDGPPLQVRGRPLGAECEEGECSDMCAPSLNVFAEVGVCGQCNDSSDCSDGEVCGATDPNAPHLSLYRACGAPARQQLGERCGEHGECSTGVCCFGICSTCCLEGGCEPGIECEPSPALRDDAYFLAPSQCGPGAGTMALGDACLAHADCQSGSCLGTGALTLCRRDGRECVVDLDCQEEGGCVTVGTRGGECQ